MSQAYPGLEICDHSIPSGAHLMELKLCENCPNTFVRRVHSGIKYCGPCRGRQLMPMNLDDYRDELSAADASSKHSNKLPKYDDSLLPKQSGARFLPVGIKRRVRRDYGDWRERLLIAFSQQSLA